MPTRPKVCFRSQKTRKPPLYSPSESLVLIPKIIHQTWRDHDLPVPAALPESWKALNPDWDYRFWTDDDLANIVEQHYPDIWPIFQATTNPVQKADIARYLMLHRYGGIYADIDTECVGTLDVLAHETRVVLSQEPTEHWGHAEVRNMDMVVFNGVMASPKGHPFWLDVMQMLHRCRHANKGVLESTGPLMLTGCVMEYAHPEQLAMHSCHLFNPQIKGGAISTAKEFGPLAPARICNHLWYGTWLKKPAAFNRLRAVLSAPRSGVSKLMYHLFRGPYLSKAAAAKMLDTTMLTGPLPQVDTPENIAIFVPVRNATPHLERCFELINRLDTPKDRLKLVFCEGDSTDGTYEMLVKLADKHRAQFRDIIITQHSTGNRVTARNRWHRALQKHRRGCIAKVRNHLLKVGLTAADDWALWIDVDVCEYAPDVLTRLLSERQKIVAPNCVKTPGGMSFDLNSFLDLGTPRDSYYYSNAKGGLFQPERSYYWRSHFDDLRFLQRTPLSAVGGTMLLVHGSVHRAGVTFPEIPYDDLLETEGFGKMAADFGVVPLGLPNLEIFHVDG